MFGRRFCCHRRAVTEKSDHASGAAGSSSFVGQMSAKFENEATGGEVVSGEVISESTRGDITSVSAHMSLGSLVL